MFPNEDDLTVLVAGFHRSRLADVSRRPRELPTGRLVSALPEGPDLSGARARLQADRRARRAERAAPAAKPGVALVGDAALPPIPSFGRRLRLGLPERRVAGRPHGRRRRRRAATSIAALARYRRAFRRRLLLHYLQVTDFASGRRLRANERIGMRAAAANPAYARAVEEVTSRRRSPLRLFGPRLTRMMVPVSGRWTTVVISA